MSEGSRRAVGAPGRRRPAASLMPPPHRLPSSSATPMGRYAAPTAVGLRENGGAASRPGKTVKDTNTAMGGQKECGLRRPSTEVLSLLPSLPWHDTLTRPECRRAHSVVGRQRRLDEEAQGLPRRPHHRPRHLARQLLGNWGQTCRHLERHGVSRRRIPACAR